MKDASTYVLLSVVRADRRPSSEGDAIIETDLEMEAVFEGRKVTGTMLGLDESYDDEAAQRAAEMVRTLRAKARLSRLYAYRQEELDRLRKELDES